MKINRNSGLAWKRNGMYGRVKGQISMLKQLVTYPLTEQEKARISLSKEFLQDIIKDRDKNIKEFGKINGFKKYQDDKI